MQIVRPARVRGGERFAVVFAAIGISFREADSCREVFERSESRDRTRVFLNLASDPTVGRLMNLGIRADRTREAHRGVADQLCAF